MERLGVLRKIPIVRNRRTQQLQLEGTSKTTRVPESALRPSGDLIENIKQASGKSKSGSLKETVLSS